MSIFINPGDGKKEVKKIYVNIGRIKELTSVWVNRDGVATKTFASGSGYAYVIAGSKPYVYVSDDLVTFKKIGEGFFSGNITNVIYAFGKFIAVGIGGDTYYSADGINWVANTLIASAVSASELIMADDKIVCSFGGSSVTHLYQTTDGVNWSVLSSTAPYMNRLAYGNGRYVGTVNGVNTYYSIDGLTWAPGTTLTRSITNIANLGKYFAGISNSGSSDFYPQIHYSFTGISWTSENLMNGSLYKNYSPRKIITFNNTFFAYFYTSYLKGFKSTSGYTWSGATDSLFVPGLIDVANSQIIIIGTDKAVYRSNDGDKFYSTGGALPESLSSGSVAFKSD